MQDDHTIRLANAVENDFVVHRDDRSKVDHFQVVLVSDFKRGIDGRAPGNNGDRVAFPADSAFAERNPKICNRLPGLGTDVAVQPLVFQKDHWIIGARSSLDESLGVLGAAWITNVPSRYVGIKRLR